MILYRTCENIRIISKSRACFDNIIFISLARQYGLLPETIDRFENILASIFTSVSSVNRLSALYDLSDIVRFFSMISINQEKVASFWSDKNKGFFIQSFTLKKHEKRSDM